MILVFHFHHHADQHQRVKLSLEGEPHREGKSVEKKSVHECPNSRCQQSIFYQFNENMVH